jgi:hypothetical protein
MARLGKSSRSAGQHQGSGFVAHIADLVRSAAKDLFDSYRPEQHYMRGPGPKWHAKHAPAMIRVHAR